MSILDEPVRGGYADLSVLGYPGRERLEMFGSRLPYPPYVHLLGIELLEIGDGWTRTAMPATRWLLSPQGRVPLGMVAVLADVSFGSALETRLPGGQVYTTSELSMQRLGSAAIGTTITAMSDLIYAGADVALASTSIVDGTGRLIAHGTARMTMFPPMEEFSERPGELPCYEAPVFDSPDPWKRDPESPPLDQNVYERCTGREIVEKQIDGSLPRAPLADLIGLEPVSAGDGVVEVKMPAHPWLSNHMMGIHGGFLATMADSAMQMAIQTTTKVANRFAPLDFKINLLRPVSPDGSELKAHGSVTYRGRTNTLASAEIVNHKGKTVAVASGAAMFGPAELL